MSTYRATVRIEDGTLHTARPLTAPEHAADLIDSVVYSMQDPGRSGALQSVEVVIVTTEDSGTPIGDSVTGSSSTPLPDDDADDGLPTLTVPGGQA